MCRCGGHCRGCALRDENVQTADHGQQLLRCHNQLTEAGSFNEMTAEGSQALGDDQTCKHKELKRGDEPCDGPEGSA